MALLRLVNHYNYDHVAPRRELRLGVEVRISPTASFRNASRIEIGSRTRIGDRCALWAGDRLGGIHIGEDCSFGPGVYVTASNYGIYRGKPVMYQEKDELDVVVGDGCWLGANAIVLAGVTIGAGCVIGAGAVVTSDLPADAVAVGVPARIVATRPEIVS